MPERNRSPYPSISQWCCWDFAMSFNHFLEKSSSTECTKAIDVTENVLATE
eukprot:gnl/Chilomastix_caulleri/2723.p2 GENE.gnl/Chilomastix_caulleri/2723~~gnl/Chilomastix_caulleri/2723.p2  ORF type:complete len:51 (+),score=6.86 gnl/Chilomastix_caulleri/2723:244-396(+)